MKYAHTLVIMAKALHDGPPGECRLSVRWPPTIKPSQPAWAVNPLVCRYHPHPSNNQPKSFYSFYWVEGLVDQGTAVRVYRPRPRLYIAALVHCD